MCTDHLYFCQSLWAVCMIACYHIRSIKLKVLCNVAMKLNFAVPAEKWSGAVDSLDSLGTLKMVFVIKNIN